MKRYTVVITETSAKRVIVEANSPREAEDKVRKGWEESEDKYILDYSNFVDVDFQTIGEE